MLRGTVRSDEGGGGRQRRIVIISPGVPSAEEGASVVLFYHYIRAFKEAGFRILSLLAVEPGNYTDADITAFEADLGSPGQFQVKVNFAEQYFDWSMLDYRLIPDSIRDIQDAVQEFRPEAVVCMDVLCAAAAANLPVPVKLVWLGDLRFQSDWHHIWYGLREDLSTARSIPTLLRACLMWRRFYVRTLHHFQSIVVSSKSSETALEKLNLGSKYLPYPWPNSSSPVDPGKRLLPKRPTFYFFGSLTGLGSRSAFHFLIKKLYPRLLRIWGSKGFRILISGRGALPTWVERDIDRTSELVYLGFVDNLDSVIAQSHAVLAPLDVPVGNRSRILTAMAKKALVIAHENASLGNPALVDGETCLLARTADEFIACMQQAFEQPEKGYEICDRARACYETDFAPEAAGPKLVENLLETMALNCTRSGGIGGFDATPASYPPDDRVRKQ